MTPSPITVNITGSLTITIAPGGGLPTPPAVLDDFSLGGGIALDPASPPPAGFAALAETGLAGALGGARKLWLGDGEFSNGEIVSLGINNDFGGPSLAHSNNGPNRARMRVVWDGGAGNPEDIDAAGLGAIDLSGAAALRFRFAYWDAGQSITVTLYSAAGAQSAGATLANPGLVSEPWTSLDIPFATFQGALDLSSISAVAIESQPDAGVAMYLSGIEII